MRRRFRQHIHVIHIGGGAAESRATHARARAIAPIPPLGTILAMVFNLLALFRRQDRIVGCPGSLTNCLHLLALLWGQVQPWPLALFPRCFQHCPLFGR